MLLDLSPSPSTSPCVTLASRTECYQCLFCHIYFAHVSNLEELHLTGMPLNVRGECLCVLMEDVVLGQIG